MSLLLWIAFLGARNLLADGALKFALSYGDHMVLQRGPAHAIVWGFADSVGSDVTVTISGGKGSATGKVVSGTHGGSPTWTVKLPAVVDKGPFTVTATGKDGTATLHDVLFGDVFLCSGQSNMEFNVGQLENGTQELQHAQQFKDIRVMNVAHQTSNVPIPDLKQLWIPWTGPSNNIKSFSAVCWLFAVQLYPHLNYPIGLIESNFGGTKIEPWSSSDAISHCTTHGKRQSDTPGVLWNGMIEPLTKTTLKGFLWYQGESNWANFQDYACMFPAMVSDWRQKFNKGSLGENSLNLPFGFVQLAGYHDSTDQWAFPGIRWSQTAALGMVPNAKLPNVFMAVAMDLPDFTSPYDPIHPRDKFDVAARLALGARNLIYGEKNVQFQGPYPSAFTQDASAHTIHITFQFGPITVNNNNGFEVCCTATFEACNWQWKAAPMTSHDANSVTVSTTACGASRVQAVRYAWRESPCHFKQCTIYGAQTSLPAPLFVHQL